MKSPDQLTQLTPLPETPFTIGRTGANLWTETAQPGNFFWVETASTETTLSMADSDRGFLFEIDLNKGIVNFSYNDPTNVNTDFFLLYRLRSAF